jgi:uncharacterized protein YndB with AHSA1/START domain
MKTISTVDIRHAAREVFAYLWQSQKLALWLTDFQSSSRSLDGPVGTELTMTFRQMGAGTRDAATVIVASETNHRLAYKMVDQSFEVVLDFLVESVGDLTRVTQILVATPKNETMAAMAAQFESIAAKQHQSDLDRLKILVEANEV